MVGLDLCPADPLGRRLSTSFYLVGKMEGPQGSQSRALGDTAVERCPARLDKSGEMAEGYSTSAPDTWPVEDFMKTLQSLLLDSSCIQSSRLD